MEVEFAAPVGTRMVMELEGGLRVLGRRPRGRARGQSHQRAPGRADGDAAAEGRVPVIRLGTAALRSNSGVPSTDCHRVVVRGAAGVKAEPNDFGPANIGQLKNVFNFDVGALVAAADPDADFDGDGIPNGDELDGPNPTDPFKWDSDGDGVSDGDEQAADTDPNDAESVPVLQDPYLRTSEVGLEYDDVYTGLDGNGQPTWGGELTRWDDDDYWIELLPQPLGVAALNGMLPPCVASPYEPHLGERSAVSIAYVDSESGLSELTLGREWLTAHTYGRREWLVVDVARDYEIRRTYLKVTEKSVNGAPIELVDAEGVELVIPARAYHSDPIAYAAEIIEPSGAGEWADVYVSLVPVEIAFDRNRDGEIVPGDLGDRTSDDEPYRFWLNNDHDTYTVDTYNSNYDHPWTSESRDMDNNYIEQERDLEDLARLHIRVPAFHGALRNGDLVARLKWIPNTYFPEVPPGSKPVPGIRLFRAHDDDGGTGYLSDGSKAAAQMAEGRNGIGKVEGTTAFELPADVWTDISESQPTLFLLFEGISEGKGELRLELLKDEMVLGDAGSAFLQILDIRKMYQRWRVSPSAVIDDPDEVASPVVSGVVPESDQGGFVFESAWDEDLDDKTYVVCIHGWKKTLVAARANEITIFKRMWHRGFKGRFAGFYWPTLATESSFNYSEYRAWKCGDALKSLVDSGLPAGYQANLVAHSLGNVVAGSAVEAGMGVRNFALLNGALPAQCFDPDPSLVQDAATQTFEGAAYDAWAGGDLGDDPVPGLRAMAYRNRVPPLQTGRMISFHLVDDAATRDAWEANQWGWRDGVPGIDTKPVDGYDYEVGAHLNFDPVFGGSRGVTDAHEAMAMVNRSMTKAVGAESRTAGAITLSVDLNGFLMSFDDDHEATFTFRCHRTWRFYELLLSNLGYVVIP